MADIEAQNITPADAEGDDKPTLLSMPEEIQTAIIDEVAELDTLKALRQTCHALADLKRINARIFETITLKPDQEHISPFRQTLHKKRGLVKQVVFAPKVVLCDSGNLGEIAEQRRYALNCGHGMAGILQNLPNLSGFTSAGVGVGLETAVEALPSNHHVFGLLAQSISLANPAPVTLDVHHDQIDWMKTCENWVPFYGPYFEGSYFDFRRCPYWDNLDLTRLKNLVYRPVLSKGYDYVDGTQPELGLSQILQRCQQTLEDLRLDRLDLGGGGLVKGIQMHSLRNLDISNSKLEMEPTFYHVVYFPDFIQACQSLANLSMKNCDGSGARAARFNVWFWLFQSVKFHANRLHVTIVDLVAHTRAGNKELSLTYDMSKPEPQDEERDTVLVTGVKRYLAGVGDREDWPWEDYKTEAETREHFLIDEHGQRIGEEDEDDDAI